MIIRTYVVKVATEDRVTDKELEDALDNISNSIHSANNCDVEKVAERRTDVDKHLNPWGTMEESDEWNRLAQVELAKE